MTSQEQQLIDELVDRIRSTNVQDKDVAAEQHLQQGLAGTPDSLYILAQTVIVQKYGLEQAQQRLQAQQSELDSLRDQAAQAQTAKPSGGSFLSHIFGGDSQQNQPPAPPQQQQGWQQVSGPAYGQPNYPPPGYGQQGYGQQGYPPAPNYQPGYGSPMVGGGGGFLRGAMQTAAGVAAGAVAFEGIESLFHGFGGGGGFGGGRGFEGDRPSETIINNYNDDGPRHESSGDRDDRGDRNDRNDRDDSSFYNPNDDASRGGDAHGFAGSGDNRNDDTSNDDGSDGSNDFDSGDDNNDYSGGDDSN